MSGKEMLAEEQRLLKWLETVPQEREAIIADSTEAKLDALIKKEREALARIQEIRKEKGRLYHATTPTAREIELEERIRDLAIRERHAFDDARRIGGMTEKFIREDSVEFHRRRHDEAKAKLAKLQREFGENTSSVTTPGGRIRFEAKEYETIIDEWHKDEPTAKLGARIWRLREERKELTAELEGLREKRKQAAVAAA